MLASVAVAVDSRLAPTAPLTHSSRNLAMLDGAVFLQSVAAKRRQGQAAGTEEAPKPGQLRSKKDAAEGEHGE
eukprot:CAMPEP_0194755282 /NCGR_PEP_ID=MMETSP0323_2-20130528/9179_1 /TAXON_ID=2866 ORGANISM="Crypthecodinium cohnii, Strain Seligo" /NCGR_SAMPLE_ID=MMETSP0323_2 /ASSEMBLY_ACC=CAM_ASM_000346 /LENGTH=72 /DNA_ID=CAMNT_0039674271 /DNA_START=81 /DNA_END=299 /DNA_ORIENTATION=-